MDSGLGLAARLLGRTSGRIPGPTIAGFPFAAWLRPLFRKDCVVYAKRPFGDP